MSGDAVDLRRRGDWLELRVGGTKVLDVYLDDPLLERGIAIPLGQAEALRRVDDALRYGA